MINSGLKLGVLIDALKKFAKDEPVRYDFGGLVPTKLDSYRGYYEDLALGFSEGQKYPSPTVGELLQELESAVGKTFTGWKGGNYRMDANTTLWVANRGETSDTVVLDVRQGPVCVVLTTIMEDLG